MPPRPATTLPALRSLVDFSLLPALPPRSGHARLVLRFVRKEALTLPLFRVEKALREAGDAVGERLGVPTPVRDWCFLARDGWVSVEPLPEVRLSASRFGEVQLSLAIPTPLEGVVLEGRAPAMLAKLPAAKLCDGAVAFGKATLAFHRGPFGMALLAGMVSGELREVKGAAMAIAAQQEPSPHRWRAASASLPSSSARHAAGSG